MPSSIFSMDEDFFRWFTMPDGNAKCTTIFNIFTKYVSERNISLMTKPEWEQLYFYCTAKYLFANKSLINLSTRDLYELGKHLQIDFSKVTSLLKKCYRFEYDEVKQMNFHQLFQNNAILDLNIENQFIKFGITNSLVQERIEEILSSEGIFSDSSFKKSVFQVPIYGMIRLLDSEIPSKNLLKKLKSIKKNVFDDLKNLITSDNEKKGTTIKELENIINHKDIKSVSTFILNISKIINTPVKIITDLIMPLLMVDKKNEIVLQELNATAV